MSLIHFVYIWDVIYTFLCMVDIFWYDINIIYIIFYYTHYTYLHYAWLVYISMFPIPPIIPLMNLNIPIGLQLIFVTFVTNGTYMAFFRWKPNQKLQTSCKIVTNRVVTKPHVFSSDEIFRLSINARPKPWSIDGGGNLVCKVEEKMPKAI
jgi:hypothetical protein